MSYPAFDDKTIYTNEWDEDIKIYYLDWLA